VRSRALRRKAVISVTGRGDAAVRRAPRRVADGALRGSRSLWLDGGWRPAGEAPGQLWLVARVEDLRLT
jgi:hypothetical protein